MAIFQTASGQENNGQAKPKSSKEKGSQNSIQAAIGERHVTKGPRDNYTDARIKDGYKSLTSLEEITQGTSGKFTLGGTPQYPAPSIDSFKQREAEAVARKIQFYDDLIVNGKATAKVYASRAYQKVKQGNLADAIADYNRATEMDSGVAEFWLNRGHVKLSLGDLDGAMTDCEHALTLTPSDVYAYLLRGGIRKRKDDHEGALSDTNRAIELAPAMPDGYMMRGSTRLLLNRWEDAESDFRHYCRLAEAGQDYPRFFIWIIQMRLGKREAADSELNDYLAKKDALSTTSTWSDKVGKFLVGKIPETEFFAAISTKSSDNGWQHCEAWYYAGMKKLLSGDKAAAIEDFQRCVATNQPKYTEYKLAAAELKALAP